MVKGQTDSVVISFKVHRLVAEDLEAAAAEGISEDEDPPSIHQTARDYVFKGLRAAGFTSVQEEE